MTRAKAAKEEWAGAVWRKPEPEPVADLVIDHGRDYRLVDMFILSGSVPAEVHWGDAPRPLSRPRIDLAVRGDRVEIKTGALEPVSVPWDGSEHAFENVASAVTSLAYAMNGQLRMDRRAVAVQFVDALNSVSSSLGLTPNAYQLGAHRNIVEGDEESIAPNIEVVLRELDRRGPGWRVDPEVRSRLLTAMRSRLAGANEQYIRDAQAFLASAVNLSVSEVERAWHY